MTGSAGSEVLVGTESAQSAVWEHEDDSVWQSAPAPTNERLGYLINSGAFDSNA